MRLSVLLGTVKPVVGRPGRPRKSPKKLHANKAYDFPRGAESVGDVGFSRVSPDGASMVGVKDIRPFAWLGQTAYDAL